MLVLVRAMCLTGVIALDLARQMLELHPDSYALVVSHENITNNYYGGKDKSMLSKYGSTERYLAGVIVEKPGIAPHACWCLDRVLH